MALARKPTVFISSTCYDLKQIRSDMRSFFGDDLGYDVLLSEYDQFPLDPSLDTIENCLRVVDERADIFILIIGCRYGWVTDTGHSVTNLEYLRAKAKGIPIYAFVDQNIVGSLQIWKDNPGIDFKSVVDTPKLFEFVEEVRSNDRIWTFSFNTAQDITRTLKIQISYLFNDCLSLRKKTNVNIITPKVRKLDGAAFKIAVQQPVGWEWKLFSQVLQDGIYSLLDYRKDFEYGITFAPSRSLESSVDVINFIEEKINQLNRGVDSVNKLIKEVFPIAIGKPGEPGDPDFIIYTATRLFDFYKLIIDWSLEFEVLIVDEIFSGLIKAFSRMCANTLSDIEKFSAECQQAMSQIPDYTTDDSEPIDISVTLTLSAPNLDDFNRELEIIYKKIKLNNFGCN